MRKESGSQTDHVVCDAIWQHILENSNNLSVEAVQKLASWTGPPPTKGEKQFMKNAEERVRWFLHFKIEQILSVQRKAFREVGYVPQGLNSLPPFPPKPRHKRGRKAETRWAATCVLEEWLANPGHPSFPKAAKSLGYVWSDNLRRQIQFLRVTLRRYGIKLPPRAL